MAASKAISGFGELFGVLSRTSGMSAKEVGQTMGMLRKTDGFTEETASKLASSLKEKSLNAYRRGKTGDAKYIHEDSEELRKYMAVNGMGGNVWNSSLSRGEARRGALERAQNNKQAKIDNRLNAIGRINEAREISKASGFGDFARAEKADAAKEARIEAARQKIRSSTKFSSGTRTLGEDGKPITKLEAGYNAMRDGDIKTAKSIARNNAKIDGEKNIGVDAGAYERGLKRAEQKARVKENIRENQEVRAAIQKGSMHEGHEGGFSKFASDEAAAAPVPEPSAKPPYSVADSPVANEPISGYKGGAGKEQAPATPDSGQPVPQNAGGAGTNPAKEAKASSEPALKSNEPVGNTSNTPKSGESVPQNASDFSDTGAGSDKDPMEEFFSGKLNQNGLSNADKYKLNRVKNDYQNYNALKGELAEDDADGLAKLNEKYGIKAGTNVEDHFKAQANGQATTMDWIFGNHVPEYGLGTAMVGGAVAACFSNKGKMSNAQLYGA